jgi:hypothetical protein
LQIAHCRPGSASPFDPIERLSIIAVQAADAQNIEAPAAVTATTSRNAFPPLVASDNVPATAATMTATIPMRRNVPGGVAEKRSSFPQDSHFIAENSLANVTHLYAHGVSQTSLALELD